MLYAVKVFGDPYRIHVTPDCGFSQTARFIACRKLAAMVDGVRSVRRELVTELVIAESQHEAVEEQYFWPAVRQQVPTGERMAEQALKQEQAAKHLLDKLDKASPDEPEFEQLISKVIEDGRAHIAYEQDTVWPAVRDSLSQSGLDELGEKIAKGEEIRADPAAPAHNRPALAC